VGRSEFTSVRWQKSSASAANGDCVEVGPAPDLVLIRNSKHPSGPVLSFSYAEWAAFVIGVRDGEFDFAGPAAAKSTPGDASS
jgi:predicted secreted Zn-dependent protease